MAAPLHFDPELFDALKELTGDRRSVANIQQSGILGEAAFAADRLEVAGVKARDRWRHQWFDRIMRDLAGCDLVFTDPDNGLVPNDRFRPARLENAKRIPIAEAMALALKQASRARGASFGCASWHKANLEAAQRTMSQVSRDEMAC